MIRVRGPEVPATPRVAGALLDYVVELERRAHVSIDDRRHALARVPEALEFLAALRDLRAQAAAAVAMSVDGHVSTSVDGHRATVDLDELIGTAEAAELLDRDPRQVARYCETGRLRGKRFGKAWVMRRSDVEQMANEET